MNAKIEVLRISGELVERLSREARRCYPREACGFLLGKHKGAEACVRRLLKAENRAQRSDRFLIDAREVFDVMRSARDEGQDVLGVYHSHPDAPPEPSATDLADAWHEWLYLIVSVTASAPMAPPLSMTTPAQAAPASIEKPRRDTDMACWGWDGERFTAVQLSCGADSGEAAP